MRIVVPKRRVVWSPGFSRQGVRRLDGPGHFDALIQSPVRPAKAGTPNGFTMVEIAIAVAVIAFALVAIIGVLPAGLQVQKENREDTLMAQDGTYWMEAIRNGAVGLDDLAQYVSRIEVRKPTTIERYSNFTSGRDIVGLLSTPGPGITNVAFVRAIAGALSEKDPTFAEVAFRYRLDVEIVPFEPALPPEEFLVRSNLNYRLHEVRLLFRWPILPNGSLGNGRQAMRSLVSGELPGFPTNNPTYFFFRP